MSAIRGRALVTGATGGLGQAIARALAARGAEVVVTGRRAALLEPLAAEIGGRALPCDLADRPAVDALAGEAGEIEILVANAGLPAAGPLEDFSAAQVDRALDVNLRAPVLLARALTPAMVARGHGHLVFVNSLAGKASTGGQSLYAATKYGLRGFALGLREDLAPAGVGVSTVFPGFIREAGMFADTGVRLPRGVGTRTPADVSRAVVEAIERDRGEVDVAPLGLRVGATVAGVFPGVGRALRRRIRGSDQVAGDLAAAPSHRAKR